MQVQPQENMVLRTVIMAGGKYSSRVAILGQQDPYKVSAVGTHAEPFHGKGMDKSLAGYQTELVES